MTATHHVGIGDIAWQTVARYLLEKGWVRDGDDPGIWIDSNAPAWPPTTIGNAFAYQLDADHVDERQAL